MPTACSCRPDAVASSLTPVAGTAHVWHAFPDGGACVPTDDGGWIYVSNTENPPPTDLPVATRCTPGKAGTSSRGSGSSDR